MIPSPHTLHFRDRGKHRAVRSRQVNVKDSETIYRQFVQFEERAAALYLQMASRFSQDPDLSSFWLDMAMQEKQHAGLLQFCVYEKLFATQLPDENEIRRLGTFFESLEQQARDPNLTVGQAFLIAMQLETSEINAIYCHLTANLHRSLYLLRRKIATDLPHHVDELATAARKFGVREDALEQLDRVKENCAAQWR
jgi:rubrerythrin